MSKESRYIMIGLVAFSVGALAAEDASPRCAANQVRAVHVESPNSAWQHWAVLPSAYVMHLQTGMLYGNQAALSSFGPNFFVPVACSPMAAPTELLSMPFRHAPIKQRTRHSAQP